MAPMKKDESSSMTSPAVQNSSSSTSLHSGTPKQNTAPNANANASNDPRTTASASSSSEDNPFSRNPLFTSFFAPFLHSIQQPHILLPIAFLLFLSSNILPYIALRHTRQRQKAYFKKIYPSMYHGVPATHPPSVNLEPHQFHVDPKTDWYMKFMLGEDEEEEKRGLPGKTCVAPKDIYLCTVDPWTSIGIKMSERLVEKYPNHPKTLEITTMFNDYHHNHPKITYEQAMESLKHLNIGVPQRIDGSEAEKEAVKEVMIQTEYYFRSEVLTHPAYYRDVRNLGVCQNTNELCAFWTSVGECESNRGFMLSHCSASCRLCALLFMNLNTMVY